ncbi:MAG: hypothetical protein NZM09_04505 [Ignavibacterium sp.]|nr:hypothetical protein [Ignavibacterium sp.]MDW8374939.1 hypothetical protein [Ignavibacteriales bacterium]
MQPSFIRNIILVIEAIISFFLLQIFQFIFGFANPIYLGLMIILFSAIIFITTYIFVKRSEKKSRILNVNINAEPIR